MQDYKVDTSIHGEVYHLVVSTNQDHNIASMDITCSSERITSGEQDVLYILSLYVSPSHRKKGVGRWLVKYGLGEMMKTFPHVRVSMVDDMSSSSLYDRLGYVPVSPHGPEKQLNLSLLFQ